jgi:hypothetical protein
VRVGELQLDRWYSSEKKRERERERVCVCVVSHDTLYASHRIRCFAWYQIGPTLCSNRGVSRQNLTTESHNRVTEVPHTIRNTLSLHAHRAAYPNGTPKQTLPCISSRKNQRLRTRRALRRTGSKVLRMSSPSVCVCVCVCVHARNIRVNTFSYTHVCSRSN